MSLHAYGAKDVTLFLLKLGNDCQRLQQAATERQDQDLGNKLPCAFYRDQQQTSVCVRGSQRPYTIGSSDANSDVIELISSEDVHVGIIMVQTQQFYFWELSW